ncbi:hypothetical protein ACFWNT_47165, partial [Streptomyces sp. NPDC058409]|uniref:hypothetical protein n=1 Tax=Streptomyces sp. NPDC058409 TaxID=3346484 RepID=UPI0036505DE0
MRPSYWHVRHVWHAHRKVAAAAPAAHDPRPAAHEASAAARGTRAAAREGVSASAAPRTTAPRTAEGPGA